MKNPSSVEAVATQTVVPTPKQKNRSHLPSIDGLRGLAAMGVVYYHGWCWNRTPQPQLSFFGIDIPVYQAFAPGYSGVYLFFVLSGFCLSYPFFSNPKRPDHWPTYFLNRIRRIFPAYAISFVAFFLLGQCIHGIEKHHGLPRFLNHLGPNFLYEKFKVGKFISEFFLIQKSRIVGSYWTLIMEWRWYLLFPAFIVMARRFSPAFVFALTCGIYYLAKIPMVAEVVDAATFSRVLAALPLFGLGIWAAYLTVMDMERLYRWERWMVSHAHMGVLAGLLWCVAFYPPITGASVHERQIAWGPLYFFLVLAAVRHSVFRKVLGCAPLAKMGLFSYSLYLVQEPIIIATNRLLHRQEHGAWTYLFTNFLLAPSLCILAGWAFYHIGERPFMKRFKAA